MEKLLSAAAARADQAEVYTRETTEDRVENVNGKLHDIKSSRLAGTALRIIKDGCEGQAFTRNMVDPGTLVDHAIASLKGGVEAQYAFPRTKDLPEVARTDPAIADVTTKEMAEECARVHSLLAARVEGDLAITAFKHRARFSVENSTGTAAVRDRSGATLRPTPR